MKRMTVLAVLFLAPFAASVGCSDKATSKRTETVEGPGGKTQIEHKDTVKQSGDNPPNP